ncbi:MAG: hypothetical protein WA715_19230 [Candidatus Acidiferrum sp.]
MTREDIMKARFFTASLLCFVLAPVGPSLQDQAASGNDRYDVCVAKIESGPPQEAYNSCTEYLEQSPPDDSEGVPRVKTWVMLYKEIRPYMQFLQSLTSDEKGRWLLYEPDMAVELPQTSETEGRYTIHIARSFANLTEEALLRKAEAVYQGPNEMIRDALRSSGGRVDQLLREMAPIWGEPGNDNIELTTVITAGAVRYYYDLTRAARKEPRLPTGVSAQRTNLKYKAAIKYLDRYTHGKDAYDGVYVADLTLQWGFTCGGLCGMGFTRNKLVVLDGHGNVVAMYLDAPVNSESWVS